jgi:RHS repeat-associated protein
VTSQQESGSQRKDHTLVSPPAISLPKGGGAIKGIGEKFSANPVTGTGTMSVPIALSPGRNGFGPQLSLSYDSGSGQGVFGLGWQLPIPSISRKTDKGLPRYDDAKPDTFLISGSEDLVPILENGIATKQSVRLWGKNFDVFLYRPRIEGLFARIEYWVDNTDSDNQFWRSISRDNITTWYGLDEVSRIFNPENPAQIFQWLICKTHDDKGNICIYDYIVDQSSNPNKSDIWESNRLEFSYKSNRYLKRVLYGNRQAYLPTYHQEQLEHKITDWMFEAVFDYGDHSVESPLPNENIPVPNGDWPQRIDAFSNHRAGFEIRTDKLCRRVLMFHHFPEDAETRNNYLVKSTDFLYHTGDLKNPSIAGYTKLKAVTHHTYQKRNVTDSTYEMRQFPPIEFSYTNPEIDQTLYQIGRDQLGNLPVGTQGAEYRWLDLNGEGLSGVLAESASGWYYKPNLGNGNFGPSQLVKKLPLVMTANAKHQFMDLTGDGEIELVDFNGNTPGFYKRDSEQEWKQHIPFLNLPAINWQDPNLRFLDLTGDGHADAVITEQDVFTWYPSLDERGFDKAEQTRQAINEDLGPRLVFADVIQTIFLADMCGDGLTDIVRIRNGEVCYWPNLGYGKFGRKVTLGNSPVFESSDLFDPNRIRLSDVDGSGPIDIIYLSRKGASIYFNRSGNFLSDPFFVELPIATENLNAVQVADLMGNGTACLVWNSHLPADSERPICYIDLMGGSRDSKQKNFSINRKPHLLIGVDNNLGLTTRIEYLPSTHFYLQDKKEGKPWITHLPFPVYCVSKTTLEDKWRGTVFSSHYSYHHGYFDGFEREFRGFGRVEQVDTELFALFAENNVGSPWITQDKKLYQPPIKSITWYHTGAAADHQKIISQYEQEFFEYQFKDRLDQAATAFHEKKLFEPDLPDDLTAEEWREALRACKGLVLRQEIYELDVDELTAAEPKYSPVRLYSAVNRNCNIQCLQKKQHNRHAIFLVTESETLSYQYELVIAKNGMLLPDPRISHTMNLRQDQYGNPQQKIAIGYKRWKPAALTHLPNYLLIDEVQAEEHLAYTELHYTNDVSLPDDPDNRSLEHYRLGIPFETLTYELKGIPKEHDFYYCLRDFRRLRLSERYDLASNLTAVQSLQYHQMADGAVEQCRLVEHTCTRFFDDAAGTPINALPFGELGPRGLKYEDYTLALTTELLSAVFTSTNEDDTTDDKLSWMVNSTQSVRQLLNEPLAGHNLHYLKTGYIRGDAINAGFVDQYWMRSGIAGFDSNSHQHFYLPNLYTDPFGNQTRLTYDALYLFITGSADAKGNTSGIAINNSKPRFNYRVLSPIEMVDANGNHTEVVFDILGLVIATATKGKFIQNSWQGDHLNDFDFDRTNPVEKNVADFCSKPMFDQQQEILVRDWLAGASTRFIYHFGESRNSHNQPEWKSRMPAACGIDREIHLGQPGGSASPLQISLECSDGSGAVVMKKVQAELESNLTSPPATDSARRWIINGLTLVNNKGKPVKQYEPAFSNDFGCEKPQANGVSVTLFYDAAGRVVRTEFPDGTVSKIEFSPWFSRSFDQNDTVLESQWYTSRNQLNPTSPLPSSADPYQRAGWLAAQHANTSNEIHLDSLGREVISIAHNRKHGVDEKYVTFTKMDAEGKPLWVQDARGSLVMQYVYPYAKDNRSIPDHFVPCYDIAGNLLFQHSMDAGDRWTINDAAGKPLFAWDLYQANSNAPKQKRLYCTDYDELHRPIALWLKVDNTDPKQIERFEYQDAQQDSSGHSYDENNLNSQVIRHFDHSGLLENNKMDFAGNLLRVSRSLIHDKSSSITNWNQVNESARLALLELDPITSTRVIYTKITEYDALKRPQSLFNWHKGDGEKVAVYFPRYNQRGLLVSEDLVIGATKDNSVEGYSGGKTQAAIVDIHYDAKGQREYLKLGNGTISRYFYDPSTYRLTQLRTTRPQYDQSSEDFHSQLNNQQVLQQLHYTYDPVGNITEVFDEAYKPVFFSNAVIEPKSTYEYDALYRLIRATGREEGSRLTVPQQIEQLPQDVVFPITASNALRKYTQDYLYDAVGNILQMNHQAGAGSWVREYEYAVDDLTMPASNRLLKTTQGSNLVNYQYDSHGSMLNLANVPDEFSMQWDHRDMISNINLGNGTAHYQYDSNKQRTRKWINRNESVSGNTQNITEERIYLGSLEIYRRTLNGVLVEEIETLHLFDGDKRFLVIDQILKTNNRKLSTGNLFRYTISNHLGSSTAELDEQAQIISCEEYHPYGTSAYRAGRSDAEVKLKRYRYTGMERDEESGLSYHTARYYLPWLGRWGSCDPIGIDDGVNIYLYVSCNPINKVDRTGNQEQMHLIESIEIPTWALRGKTEAYHDLIRRFVSGEAYSWGEVPENFVNGHVSSTPHFKTPAGQPQIISPQTASSNALQSSLERIEAGRIRASNQKLIAEGKLGPLQFLREKRIDTAAPKGMSTPGDIPQDIREAANSFNPKNPPPKPTPTSGRSLATEPFQTSLDLGPTRSTKGSPAAIKEINVEFDLGNTASVKPPQVVEIAPVEVNPVVEVTPVAKVQAPRISIGSGVAFCFNVIGFMQTVLMVIEFHNYQKDLSETGFGIFQGAATRVGDSYINLPDGTEVEYKMGLNNPLPGLNGRVRGGQFYPDSI